MPDISVITPAYHADAFIAEAVRSVLTQSGCDFEIVIASDDQCNYEQLLQQQGITDSRIRCVYTGGIGTGPARARNAALRAASGRCVIFLDADDLLRPAAMQTIHKAVKSYGAVYYDTQCVSFSQDEMVHNYGRLMPTGVTCLQDVLTSSVQHAINIAFDRHRLSDIFFLEQFPVWEDLLFLASVCDRFNGLYHIAIPLYVYRRRAGSLCNNPEAGKLFYDTAKKILEALYAEAIPGLSPPTRTLLTRYFTRRQEIERIFMQAEAAGHYRDYNHFMGENLDLFYTL